jgi:hypothetical protein
MTSPPVPSLFRQTLISSTKRREPIRTEIPAQRHDRSYGDQHQKFELHSHRVGSRLTPGAMSLTGSKQPGSASQHLLPAPPGR